MTIREQEPLRRFTIDITPKWMDLIRMAKAMAPNDAQRAILDELAKLAKIADGEDERRVIAARPDVESFPDGARVENVGGGLFLITDANQAAADPDDNPTGFVALVNADGYMGLAESIVAAIYRAVGEYVGVDETSRISELVETPGVLASADDRCARCGFTRYEHSLADDDVATDPATVPCDDFQGGEAS